MTEYPRQLNGFLGKSVAFVARYRKPWLPFGGFKTSTPKAQAGLIAMQSLTSMLMILPFLCYPLRPCVLGIFWARTQSPMRAMGRPWLPPMASRTGSSEVRAGLFAMEGLNKQVCRLYIGAVYSQFT